VFLQAQTRAATIFQSTGYYSGTSDSQHLSLLGTAGYNLGFPQALTIFHSTGFYSGIYVVTNWVLLRHFLYVDSIGARAAAVIFHSTGYYSQQLSPWHNMV